MGLRMLLLLHALIPCLAAYILPSSPVLLHINILPSSPVLLHIYTALASLLFGTVIPTSLNILMEMFLLPFIILYSFTRPKGVLQTILLVKGTVAAYSLLWFVVVKSLFTFVDVVDFH